jgi:hypothetical protein
MRSKFEGKIHVVCGGFKSRVGTTFLSAALVDFLLSEKANPHLISTDSACASIRNFHGGLINVSTLHLQDARDWTDLVGLLDINDKSATVLDLSADSCRSVAQCANILNSYLVEKKRKLCTLWVVDGQSSGADFHQYYTKSLSNSPVHVVRNTRSGDKPDPNSNDFTQLKQSITAAGGKFVSFPRASEQVADAVRQKHFNIASALERSSDAIKREIEAWRRSYKNMFKEIIK